MSLTPLTALSPVDGRYAARCADLREIFSEQGLIRARVRVEIAWLHALAGERRITELRGVTPADLAVAQQIVDGFDPADAATVKAFDRTGVEMEALTAVSVAALTVYDMTKAIDRGMVIGPIQLDEKRGGKSGVWARRPT